MGLGTWNLGPGALDLGPWTLDLGPREPTTSPAEPDRTGHSAGGGAALGAARDALRARGNAISAPAGVPENRGLERFQARTIAGADHARFQAPGAPTPSHPYSPFPHFPISSFPISPFPKETVSLCNICVPLCPAPTRAPTEQRALGTAPQPRDIARYRALLVPGGGGGVRVLASGMGAARLAAAAGIRGAGRNMSRNALHLGDPSCVVSFRSLPSG